jgi:hypothetical protein
MHAERSVGRHPFVMCGFHAGSMTASRYAITAPVYAVARPVGHATGDRPGTAHAVSRPVVDGLTSSECGLLVDATADHEWRDVSGTEKCPECERLAG